MARRRSSISIIPLSARPIGAPTAWTPAAGAMRPSTPRFLRACALGMAAKSVSIRKSIRASAFSNTLGMAGFPSGEAYKVGKAAPYFRLQRLFFRQTFDLGGDAQIGRRPPPTSLAAAQTADNLVLTARQIFGHRYFRHQRLCPRSARRFPELGDDRCRRLRLCRRCLGLHLWRRRRNGAWSRWTLRGGLFDLSRVPNATALERGFDQFELVSEGESAASACAAMTARSSCWASSIAAAWALQAMPWRWPTQRQRFPTPRWCGSTRSRPGGALNMEQGITGDLGAFPARQPQ